MAAARLNLSMDESAEKGMKLVEGKGSDAAASCDIGRIAVTGYDTWRCRKDVKRELKKLYSSCGKITDIFIPRAMDKGKTLWRYAFIYFVRERAVDKALQLNGTVIGDWTVCAEKFPFPPNAIRDVGRITVAGYDTGRCPKDVKRELKKLYSSCGEITDIYVPPPRWRAAFIYFVGEGTVDKALQLNGTDMGGWTVCAEEYEFTPYANRLAGFAVEGYDTSLSDSAIKCQFRKLFSSCGKVTGARIFKSFSSSLVFVEGENIVETAPKLSGSEIGGRKVVVRLVTRPEKSTVHYRRLKGSGICGRIWYVIDS